MGKAAGSWLALGFLAGLALAVRAGSRPRPAATAADVGDEELAARVRERVRIPGDVEVAVASGAVFLFGRIERGLARGLLERVSAVEGVTVIENRLTPVDLVAPERPPGPPDPTP